MVSTPDGGWIEDDSPMVIPTKDELEKEFEGVEN